jgi:hypothetical protein
MLKLDGSVAGGLPCHFAEAVQVELPDEGRKVGVIVVSASTSVVSDSFFRETAEDRGRHW